MLHVIEIGSVLVIVGEDEISLEDADGLMNLIHGVWSSGRRYSVFLDARGVSPPSARVRRRLGDQIGTDDDVRQDRGQHVSLVLTSKVLRGVLTAIQWFLPRAVKIASWASAVDAVDHLSAVGHPRDIDDRERLRAIAAALDDRWARDRKRPDLGGAAA